MESNQPRRLFKRISSGSPYGRQTDCDRDNNNSKLKSTKISNNSDPFGLDYFTNQSRDKCSIQGNKSCLTLENHFNNNEYLQNYKSISKKIVKSNTPTLYKCKSTSIEKVNHRVKPKELYNIKDKLAKNDCGLLVDSKISKIHSNPHVKKYHQFLSRRRHSFKVDFNSNKENEVKRNSLSTPSRNRYKVAPINTEGATYLAFNRESPMIICSINTTQNNTRKIELDKENLAKSVREKSKSKKSKSKRKTFKAKKIIKKIKFIKNSLDTNDDQLVNLMSLKLKAKRLNIKNKELHFQENLDKQTLSKDNSEISFKEKHIFKDENKNELNKNPTSQSSINLESSQKFDLNDIYNYSFKVVLNRHSQRKNLH